MDFYPTVIYFVTHAIKLAQGYRIWAVGVLARFKPIKMRRSLFPEREGHLEDDCKRKELLILTRDANCLGIHEPHHPSHNLPVSVGAQCIWLQGLAGAQVLNEAWSEFWPHSLASQNSLSVSRKRIK